MQKYVSPEEYIKRLATAQGIDLLNLVKSTSDVQAESEQQMQQAQQMELTKQAGQFASAPAMDPTKNPAIYDNELEQAEDEQPPAI